MSAQDYAITNALRPFAAAASALCSVATACAPSPTTAATRLTEPDPHVADRKDRGPARLERVAHRWLTNVEMLAQTTVTRKRPIWTASRCSDRHR